MITTPLWFVTMERCLAWVSASQWFLIMYAQW